MFFISSGPYNPSPLFDVVIISYNHAYSLQCSLTLRQPLRCLDIVFQRPYRYFSIALKVILSLSNRYKVFTND